MALNLCSRYEFVGGSGFKCLEMLETPEAGLVGIHAESSARWNQAVIAGLLFGLSRKVSLRRPLVFGFRNRLDVFFFWF